jgi:CCR4-NOT transcriptional regulation complex NOT5 subunit
VAKETMADKAKKKQKASKVSGLHEGVGKFKGKKSLNLRDKQLGKKGKAAAAKRTVSISKTEHMKEGPHKGKVVGPKGNPLTGKVDMGGGNMAVYRNGKRVTAKSSKGVKPKATSSKVTSSKATSSKATAAKATAAKAISAKATPAKAKTSTLTAAQKAAARKGSGSSAGAGAKKVSDNSSGQSRVAAGRKTGTAKNPKTTKTGNGKKWYAQGGGGLFGSNAPRLEGFLKPGKNAPKMPKYTSSNYKWKG